MRVFVLYGSETGNCESIAKDVFESLQTETSGGVDAKVDAKLHTLNEFKKIGFPPAADSDEAVTALIVCSTTGNGDAPNNADRFVRFAKRRTQSKEAFSKVRFAVFAMGDTNYDKFAYTGKLLDTRMHDLGGDRMATVHCCDEATSNMVLEVETWKSSVIKLILAADEPNGQREDAAEVGEAKNVAVTSSVMNVSLVGSSSSGVVIPPLSLGHPEVAPEVDVSASVSHARGAVGASCAVRVRDWQ